MTQFVRYKGTGGEILFDLNWQPQPGEIRAVGDEVDLANITDSPVIELATEADFKAQEAKKPEKDAPKAEKQSKPVNAQMNPQAGQGGDANTNVSK